MAYGLLVNNGIGEVLLDPDSFTMKMVASAIVQDGVYTGPKTISMPGVLPGMIGIVVPLYAGYVSGTNIMNSGIEYDGLIRAIPYCTVGTDQVTLTKSAGNDGLNTMSVAVYVLKNN